MIISEEERDAIRVALHLLIDALDYDALQPFIEGIARNEGITHTLKHDQIYDLIQKF